jgi:K+-transporting ATPase A subunit
MNTIIIRLANLNLVPKNKKKLSDDLIDASILAGLTFFTNLAAQSFIGPVQVVYAAVQAGLTFFTFLAIKRGIKK